MDVFLISLILVGLVIAIVGIVLFIIDYAKKTSKKISLTVLSVGIVISLLSFGGLAASVHHHEVVAKQEQAKQAKIEVSMKKKFKKAHSDLTANAILVSMNSETVGNEYLTVWHDAIFNDDGATVDGTSYTDFNDAVTAQEASYESDGTLDRIRSEQKSMRAALKTMKDNKTASNNASFKKAKKQVETVNKFVRVATSPSGTYSDYSSNLNDADTATSDLFN